MSYRSCRRLQSFLCQVLLRAPSRRKALPSQRTARHSLRTSRTTTWCRRLIPSNRISRPQDEAEMASELRLFPSNDPWKTPIRHPRPPSHDQFDYELGELGLRLPDACGPIRLKEGRARLDAAIQLRLLVAPFWAQRTNEHRLDTHSRWAFV